ncbi:hypothetical protein C5S30_01045 [ANME-1 cluster archaeon GoMg4]|nr:hypothetical protein [ANME-1 cluster archaeon GoMg4]
MTFDWSEYLKLARELAGENGSSANEEARLRSSISRAYFAAYCVARKCLIDKGQGIPGGPKGHRYICNFLQESIFEEEKQAGEDLDRLRNRRNQADYDDFMRNLSAVVGDSLNRSVRVISWAQGSH